MNGKSSWDGIERRRPIEIVVGRCNFCEECLPVCTRNVLLIVPNPLCARCAKYCLAFEVPCAPATIALLPDRCDRCRRCVAACRQGAIRQG